MTIAVLTTAAQLSSDNKRCQALQSVAGTRLHETLWTQAAPPYSASYPPPSAYALSGMQCLLVHLVTGHELWT